MLGGDPQDLKYKGEHDDRGDRRRHDDPRVHDDQPRHDAVVQDDGGEELLPHVVRAPGARLPHRRRRDHLERHAARRARHDRRRRRSLRGLVAVHQFATIGGYSFIGGCSRVAKDVPPYVKAVGNPIKLYGLNSVGLERNGIPEEVRRELKRAYRLFFKSELNLSQARERAAAELQPYPGDRGVPRVLRAQRSRIGGLMTGSDRRRRRGRARLSSRAHPARRSGRRRSSDFTTRDPARAATVARGARRARRSRRSTRCSTTSRRSASSCRRRRTTRSPRRRSSAGLHVLVEKPIAATLDEADALLAIAQAHRRAWCRPGTSSDSTARCARALPYVDVAAVHRERPARAVQSARLRRRRRARPDDPRHRSGAHVRRRARVPTVSAVGVPVLTPFVDIANARLTFESGAVANITASRVSRERMRKLRIFQQSGYLSLDLAAGHRRVLSSSARRGPRGARPRRAGRAGARVVRRAHRDRRAGRRAAAARARGFRARGGRRRRRSPSRATTAARRLPSRSRSSTTSSGRCPALSGARRWRPAVREILFVAGEVSGDLHAAGVARELAARGAPRFHARRHRRRRRCAPPASSSIEHVEQLAVMGFIEVLQHVPKHWALLRDLARRLRERQRGARRSDRLPDVQHEGRRRRRPRPACRCCTTSRRRCGRGAPDRLATLARDGDEGGGDSAVRGAAAARARHRRDVRRTSAARPRSTSCPIARRRARRSASPPTTACSRSFPGAARRRSAAISTRSSRRRASCSAATRRCEVIVSAAPHVDDRSARDVRFRWCDRRRSRFCAPPTPRCARAARRRSRPRSPAVRSSSRIAPAALDVCRRRRRLVKISNIGLVNVVAGARVAPEFVQDALQPRPSPTRSSRCSTAAAPSGAR